MGAGIIVHSAGRDSAVGDNHGLGPEEAERVHGCSGLNGEARTTFRPGVLASGGATSQLGGNCSSERRGAARCLPLSRAERSMTKLVSHVLKCPCNERPLNIA